jgi:hypothetical protein
MNHLLTNLLPLPVNFSNDIVNHSIGPQPGRYNVNPTSVNHTSMSQTMNKGLTHTITAGNHGGVQMVATKSAAYVSPTVVFFQSITFILLTNAFTFTYTDN